MVLPCVRSVLPPLLLQDLPVPCGCRPGIFGLFDRYLVLSAAFRMPFVLPVLYTIPNRCTNSMAETCGY